MRVKPYKIKDVEMVLCKGRLKSYEAFLEFKEGLIPLLDSLKEPKILLFFIDAYPMSPYAIGYMLKLKENDKIDVKIYTNEVKTFDLFAYLELKDKFGVEIKQL